MATIIRIVAGRRKLALTDKAIDCTGTITHDVSKMIHSNESFFLITPKTRMRKLFKHDRTDKLSEIELQEKLDKIEETSPIPVIALLG